MPNVDQGEEQTVKKDSGCETLEICFMIVIRQMGHGGITDFYFSSTENIT